MIYGNCSRLNKVLNSQRPHGYLFSHGVFCWQKGRDKMLITRKQGKVKHQCHECRELIRRGEDYITLEVYDSPFDVKSRTIYLHVGNEVREDQGISCEQALYDEQWSDFRYFDCPMCQRTIIRQCPSNGWHSYVREYDGEDICLSCYEHILLREGIARETFEAGKIEGMFFNQQDLADAGYEKASGMESIYIRTKCDAELYCSEALRVMDEGYIAVTDYERMAIGGLEGYVTMWCKQKEGIRHERKCA